jgi:hypothetical protein
MKRGTIVLALALALGPAAAAQKKDSVTLAFETVAPNRTLDVHDSNNHLDR